MKPDPARRKPSFRALGSLPTTIVAVFVAATSVSAIVSFEWAHVAGSIESFCGEHIGFLSETKCERGVQKMRFYVLSLAILPLFWLLELWRPADPNQPLFAPSVLADGIWLVALPFVTIGVLEPFGALLNNVFEPVLRGFRLDFLASLPLAGKLAVAILAGDFLAWLSHYVRHKIPPLWEFHKIHHSQTQLNYFTSVRLHPGDLLANVLIRFIPFTLLGLETGLAAFLVWSSFVRLYEMFVHSNLRMNLGLLRYIVVTPQSHRIHHSIEARHRDLNFGDFFSIWDILFRTHCFDCDVYPNVGVEAPDCPTGSATNLRSAIRSFLSELTYPIRAIARRVARP